MNTNVLTTLLLFLKLTVFTKFVEILLLIVNCAYVNMNYNRLSMMFDILPAPALSIHDRVAIISKLVAYVLYKSSCWIWNEIFSKFFCVYFCCSWLQLTRRNCSELVDFFCGRKSQAFTVYCQINIVCYWYGRRNLRQ